MNIKGLWPEPTTKTTITYACSEVYKMWDICVDWLIACYPCFQFKDIMRSIIDNLVYDLTHTITNTVP